jgi:hypothetical protein
VEALAPRAGANGTTRLAKQSKAVLTEARQAYAGSGTVLLTEAAEGGWGIVGTAYGRAEFAAIARQR